MRNIAIIFFVFYFPAFSYADEALDDEIREITLEEWIAETNSKERAVSGALVLRRFSDPVYIVQQPIRWTPKDADSALEPVEVPKGFVTDLASIPPVFFSFMRPDGKYAYAAIIHDYLYWHQSPDDRATADRIFKSAMSDFDVPNWKKSIIYRAVSWGGGAAWKHNALQKSKGEHRVLRKFPQDPKITWQEWKAREDVFAKEDD